MRIVNVLPDPRHYSYASTASGGKTLKPGEIGPELPLDRIHTAGLWKDIEANKVQIVLSDDDKSLLAKYLEEGSKELVFQKRKPVEKPKSKKQPKKPTNKKAARAPEPLATPPKPAKTKKVTHEDIKNGTVSLSDLVHNNDSIGVPKLDGTRNSMEDIKKHMGGLV